ncbi:MAG: ABC transporter transmembrane domain-containing protein [Alphaproteobacteria bacterium]
MSRLSARYGDRPGQKDMAVLRRLIAMTRPYRGRMALAALALLVSTGCVLAIGLALRKFIDDGIGADDSGAFSTALVLFSAIVVLLAGATFARAYLVNWVGERVAADLRVAAYRRVIHQDALFFETAKSGEVLARLTGDAGIVNLVIGSTATVAVRNMLLLLGGTVLLAVTNATLTGVVLLVVPLVVVPIILFGRRVRRLSRGAQDRLADAGGYASETLGAVATVQAFGHEPQDIAAFGNRVEAAFHAALRQVATRGLMAAVVIFLVFAAVIAMLCLGGAGVTRGDLTPGDLSAFVFYAVVVAGAVGGLSEVSGDLQRAAGACERLFELIDREPEIKAPADPVPLPEPARGAVAFEDVSFHYPSRPESRALHNVGFAVAPGETVAVVGPSGAGKSTLFQLLLRFRDPVEGRVTIDGVDIATADPAAVRARIGTVPQDPVIFSGSVRDNIRYGRPAADEADVAAAARAAAADGFIAALPQGYDSEIGERGVRLSGGQRQRIALARAIIRDPAILLLDEATSALDTESEAQVQAALGQLRTGRTTLVIAHRLSTVRDADRILVMESGRIVATGTHEQLMADNALYRRLATRQFADTAADGAGDPAVTALAARR